MENQKDITYQELVDFVEKYSEEDYEGKIVVCERCLKMRVVATGEEGYSEYTMGGKLYQPYCYDCGKTYPPCCINHFMYDVGIDGHYDNYPEHTMDGFYEQMCKSCIAKKEARNIKKAKN